MVVMDIFSHVPDIGEYSNINIFLVPDDSLYVCTQNIFGEIILKIHSCTECIQCRLFLVKLNLPNIATHNEFRLFASKAAYIQYVAALSKFNENCLLVNLHLPNTLVHSVNSIQDVR